MTLTGRRGERPVRPVMGGWVGGRGRGGGSPGGRRLASPALVLWVCVVLRMCESTSLDPPNNFKVAVAQHHLAVVEGVVHRPLEVRIISGRQRRVHAVQLTRCVARVIRNRVAGGWTWCGLGRPSWNGCCWASAWSQGTCVHAFASGGDLAPPSPSRVWRSCCPPRRSQCAPGLHT